jgi:hypothetical protein
MILTLFTVFRQTTLLRSFVPLTGRMPVLPFYRIFNPYIEEPRCKQRGFFVGKEFVYSIARLDSAINSGDCGEPPFTSRTLLKMG